MSIRVIDEHYHVTGQLMPVQMSELARLGYRTVICLRPDDEAPGQPAFADLAAAARAAGVELHHIPVIPGRMTPEQGDALKSILQTVEGAALAFCASGGRCAAAYQAIGG
ncbi:TIGR01244 family sulfur transferase [Rhizobium sp. G21]|uniref:TIGR01244 family sulfur transferase n=1 Tax=Rhizobium sp. G21 TaxID=2758439 RepID=UPI001600C961|nr:TIGR01244 family sulfur transferase [Rhizobium sp. G21]MBB1248548.1 TIGR01244 family phosphatase [Rhizobium sp. G21]